MTERSKEIHHGLVRRLTGRSSASGDLDAPVVIERLIDGVRTFGGEASQWEVVTIVVLRWVPQYLSVRWQLG
jgi:hypothetical protein